jgi:hypothetical protein
MPRLHQSPAVQPTDNLIHVCVCVCVNVCVCDGQVSRYDEKWDTTLSVAGAAEVRSEGCTQQVLAREPFRNYR